VVVDDQDARHGLIGWRIRADNDSMARSRDGYHSWLLGEALLLVLLGGMLAVFLVYSQPHSAYALPNLKLVLQTAGALAAGLLALLAGVRFATERRRFDMLLCLGFFVAAVGTAAFSVAPALAQQELTRAEAWSGVVARLIAWVLIAAAPFADGRVGSSRRTLGNWLAFLLIALMLLWLTMHSIDEALPALAPITATAPPALLTFAYSLNALLNLAAVVGFGLRFRKRQDDLDRWLGFGASLMLFSSLHLVFTPLLGSVEVSPGDFLRVLGYGVFCVGVWRAIQSAEFARAVADERSRLAREIHDGLAQYLFAVSTHATMLEQGGAAEELVPQIKRAATAAQQEARFAVLALSSAGGSAPFDAALQRYVELLTADGALDVDLHIDNRMRLEPDEQIELFRIVQEGLANVRRHAHARRAEVRICQRDGKRLVTIVDDGEGFDREARDDCQGLRNIRARIGSIGAALSLHTSPGAGTALEVTLRT
jgi:signal transduction histidine kinase